MSRKIKINENFTERGIQVTPNLIAKAGDTLVLSDRQWLAFQQFAGLNFYIEDLGATSEANTDPREASSTSDLPEPVDENGDPLPYGYLLTWRGDTYGLGWGPVFSSPYTNGVASEGDLIMYSEEIGGLASYPPREQYYQEDQQVGRHIRLNRGWHPTFEYAPAPGSSGSDLEYRIDSAENGSGAYVDFLTNGQTLIVKEGYSNNTLFTVTEDGLYFFYKSRGRYSMNKMDHSSPATQAL